MKLTSLITNTVLILFFFSTQLTAQSWVKLGGIKVDTLSLNRLAQTGATTNQVISWNGTTWVPVTPTAIVNLDQSYNHFGATASKINIDASEGQTGGLEFESTGSNNHITIDLQGSGDFIVQDTGINDFRIFQNGYASFGTVGPTTTQRLIVSENRASVVTTTVSHTNNIEPTDGSGVAEAFTLGSERKADITISNPVGGYTLGLDVNLLVNSTLTSMLSINADKQTVKFPFATEYGVQNLTLSSDTITGKYSVAYVPSSASTTFLFLPEIVTGVPAGHQVSVGYVVDVAIDRSVGVLVQTLGGSDVFLIHGTAGTTSVINTTGGTGFCRRFIAIGSNMWSVQ